MADEKTQRNRAMRADLAAGMRPVKVAKKYGVSRQRVHQLIKIWAKKAQQNSV